MLEHPAQGMAERKAMWDVVKPIGGLLGFKNELSMDTSEEGSTGNCSFTAEDVGPPEVGQRYR